MKLAFGALVTLLSALAVGCQPLPPPAQRSESGERSTTSERSSPHQDRSTSDRPQAEISFQTERDQQFANFVAKTAGEMIAKVAVGLEKSGTMRIQLGKSTSPEDTLPLTKSLLAGARKEFPGKSISISVFDPQAEPILKANYRPGEGVHYEVVRDGAEGPEASPKNSNPSTGPAKGGSIQSGTTEKDRQFAAWAKTKGEPFLRYVQADLERSGRLWVGITSDVKPKDVPELTKSLLQGARTEFPRQELTATVFDPEGERIGRATLDLRGNVSWHK
jgi:hypothetical protein